MKINKKSLFTISALAMLMLVFIFKISDLKAQGKDSVFKTSDGKIVKIIYDEKYSTEENNIEEVVSSGNEDDDEIYYGKIIKRNGSTERVYAISEDGSYITEVIEDDNEQ